MASWEADGSVTPACGGTAGAGSSAWPGIEEGVGASATSAGGAAILTASELAGGGSSSSSSGSMITASRVSATAPISRRRARRLMSFSLVDGGMVEHGGNGIKRTEDEKDRKST